MKPVKKEAVHGLKLEIKKIYHGVSRRDTELQFFNICDISVQIRGKIKRPNSQFLFSNFSVP